MQSFQMTEGRQGLNRYFTGNVPVGELEHLVRFQDELQEFKDDERMQRGFAKGRIKTLVEYLVEAPDHFFSAVTLVILPRELDRGAEEIDPDSDDQEGDYAFEPIQLDRPGRSRFGILHLSGDVVLFPGDGQHRLKAEFEAIKDKPELAREELPVVVIPFESTRQVRQLFSDLNLNAKPISKSVGYDFETRDPVVLMAKAVSRRVPLFDGRVNKVSNSLSASQKNVVTLGTLVPASQSIAEGLAQKSDVSLDEFVADNQRAEDEISQVWETIIDAFEPQWAHVVDEEHPLTAAALREEFLFPHGLGWRGLASAASQLIAKSGRGGWEKDFTRAVKALDWRRDAEVWEGTAVIHDPDGERNRVNNTGPAVRDLAAIVVAGARAR